MKVMHTASKRKQLSLPLQHCNPLSPYTFLFIFFSSICSSFAGSLNSLIHIKACFPPFFNSLMRDNCRSLHQCCTGMCNQDRRCIPICRYFYSTMFTISAIAFTMLSLLLFKHNSQWKLVAKSATRK